MDEKIRKVRVSVTKLFGVFSIDIHIYIYIYIYIYIPNINFMQCCGIGVS